MFFALATVLVASLFAPLGTSTRFAASDRIVAVRAARIQPELLAFAQAHPGASVDVIVQKEATARGSKTLEAWVAQHNGHVTADLGIINAFVAQVPAVNVEALASQPRVRWVSHDGPMKSTACADCVDTKALKSAYIRAIGADKVWNVAPYYDQGQDVGVAVVDSGVATHKDLEGLSTAQSRVLSGTLLSDGANQTTGDEYGHGTFVAGIIAGNGKAGNKQYVGVAPQANIINIKVGDDTKNGEGKTSTVVAGLQWLLDNKARYNIRVVNISLNYSVPQSYHVDPLCAAVEILWMNKIVVVVSAGNQGKGALYPPANDPFVITVGAADDKGTAAITDDTMAPFSAYGVTIDGFSKPDLVAPGKNIIGLRIGTNNGMAKDHPANIVDGNYFRLSGTSVSAPMVAAAAALLLKTEPALTPDQVKYRLKVTANRSWPNYDAAKAGAGYLDVYAALTTPSTLNANTGLPISKLLAPNLPQPQLYRAINVNGSALTIDGQAWEGDNASNYAAGPYRFCNTGVTLTVPTDSARKQMIRCSVRGDDWTGWGARNAYITLGAVPNNTYQVYAYGWEDDSPRTFALTLNGTMVRTNLNTGLAGAWARLGPFPVTVTNGQITLSTSGGSINLSGIEVYVGALNTAALGTASTVTEQSANQVEKSASDKIVVDDGHQGITTMPSPASSASPVSPASPKFVIHLPIITSGASGAAPTIQKDAAVFPTTNNDVATSAAAISGAVTRDYSSAPLESPTVTAQADGNTSIGTADASVRAVAAQTGLLNGYIDTPATSAIDLSAQGTLDWTSWGRTASNSEDRKLSGGKQIGFGSVIGNGSIARANLQNYSMQWTDGASQVAATNSYKVECYCARGEGFRFTALADRTQRVLRVYVGARSISGRLVARLSDGSAANYVDTSFATQNSYDEPIRVYTIFYRAGSNDQTLTVEWTREDGYGYNKSISIAAATLALDAAAQLAVWDNVTWESVSWSSVSWSSVSWSSVSWSSDFWSEGGN